MLPIASFPEEVIPLIATVFFLMIPIVAILTKHQQKMAMLMRNDGQFPQGNPLQQGNLGNLPGSHGFSQSQSNDIYALRQDVQQLREMVSSLAINIDNMNDRLNRQSDPQNRMKVGE
ncbi:MAG: hypothetical protein JST51_04310 [Armatimonadetes bacterium]|nr:hypothetical protein [Armatimonadota bacterium]